MKFFSTRSSKCSAGVFSTAMLLGGAISAYFSIRLFEQCLDTIQHLDEVIGDTVTIPSLSTTINIHEYSIPVSLKDVIVELPQSLLEITHSADALPDYCYKASFVVLMTLTISIALSLGACALNPPCTTSDDDIDQSDSKRAPLLGADMV